MSYNSWFKHQPSDKRAGETSDHAADGAGDRPDTDPGEFLLPPRCIFTHQPRGKDVAADAPEDAADQAAGNRAGRAADHPADRSADENAAQDAANDSRRDVIPQAADDE